MKRVPAFFVPLLVWTAVFIFWFVVSRHNHPTPLIDALASAILVGVSAACFAIHDRILRPRLLAAPRSSHGVAKYVLLLLLSIAVLDLVAVVLIQAIYDRLWGPDPLRFGFTTNVLLEAVFITVHLGVAVAVVAIVRALRNRRRKSR